MQEGGELKGHYCRLDSTPNPEAGHQHFFNPLGLQGHEDPSSEMHLVYLISV